MGVLPACTSMHYMYEMLMETRKGYQIHRNHSYRCLVAATEVLGTKLVSSARAASAALNCVTISLTPKQIYFWQQSLLQIYYFTSANTIFFVILIYSFVLIQGSLYSLVWLSQNSWCNQAGFTFKVILLPQYLECWNYRCEPQCPVKSFACLLLIQFFLFLRIFLHEYCIYII